MTSHNVNNQFVLLLDCSELVILCVYYFFEHLVQHLKASLFVALELHKTCRHLLSSRRLGSNRFLLHFGCFDNNAILKLSEPRGLRSSLLHQIKCFFFRTSAFVHVILSKQDYRQVIWRRRNNADGGLVLL